MALQLRIHPDKNPRKRYDCYFSKGSSFLRRVLRRFEQKEKNRQPCVPAEFKPQLISEGLSCSRQVAIP